MQLMYMLVYKSINHLIQIPFNQLHALNQFHRGKQFNYNNNYILFCSHKVSGISFTLTHLQTSL